MLLIFLSSYYFIYNTHRDTVPGKEFDIVIQMTLKQVLVQRFKIKEMDKKTFNKDMKMLQPQQIPLEE